MNEQDIKIVFFGTPDFARFSLEKIHKSQHQLLAVVTAPDKGVGRGRKVRFSSVKSFALEHKISLLQPKSLKDEEFLAQIAKLQADLFVVVAFRILPKVVWDMPKYGSINLHASLLPDYRGAAPIHWAIINGEEKTGLTTFFLDENVDTGKIILKKEVDISKTENVGKLHDRLMEKGAELLLQTLYAIAEMGLDTPTMAQKHIDKSLLKAAPKIFKKDCLIDWNKPALEVYNKIRGLSPYPAAYTQFTINGTPQNVKILEAKLSEEKVAENQPTSLITDDKSFIKVATSDFFIQILEIQVEGKRKMCVKDFLNGHTIS